MVICQTSLQSKTPGAPTAGRPTRYTLFTLAALISAPCSQAAITIADFSAAANDRFANDPAFIGTGFDWSGVAMSTAGSWATLVSPNVFLSANHLHGSVGQTLVFYPGNDPSATPVIRTIASGARIGSSDIWAGVLDAPAPSGIAFYALPNFSISDDTEFAASTIALQNAYMFGRSQTFSGYGSYAPTDMAVGRNRLDLWIPNVSAGGTTDNGLLAIRNLAGDGNLVAYEALLQSGDSGGPLFTLAGGQPVLTGINWATGTLVFNAGTVDEFSRQASAVSYTGNYFSAIQNVIDANPVPEPATPLGGVLLVLTLALHRRRNQPPHRTRMG